MWGIRFNNERTWFEAHKEQYKQHLYGPMRALGDELYERFQEQHRELDIIRRESRIYRTPGGSLAGGPTRTTCG